MGKKQIVFKTHKNSQIKRLDWKKERSEPGYDNINLIISFSFI